MTNQNEILNFFILPDNRDCYRRFGKNLKKWDDKEKFDPQRRTADQEIIAQASANPYRKTIAQGILYVWTVITEYIL